MKEFLILAFLFWIAGACFAKIIFLSIQRGQWLDKLLKWQQRLRNWDLSGTKKGVFFSKIGGYCELCFSHAIAFINFWVFLAFALLKLRWITNKCDTTSTFIFLNAVWYLIFICIGTMLNLYFILKFLNTKKNG